MVLIPLHPQCVHICIVSVFHVTGRPLLTFEEAGELCQEYGGRLASVSDMYDARDKGYDLCRYVFKQNVQQ